MRIDKYLCDCGKFESRTKAREAIERGEVMIDGKMAKPSSEITEGAAVKVVPSDPFVSAGGAKLQKALDDFSFSPRGGVFADIGASTGGFTECLLKNGAGRVYAIDVGESQLHPRLAADDRVTVCDKVNARYLAPSFFPELPGGFVMDVSFISIKLLFPAISRCLGDGGVLLSLIKPQFELENRVKVKNGIVRDVRARLKICEGIFDSAVSCGLIPQKFTTAPIREGKNIEYLMLFAKNGLPLLDKKEIAETVMKNNRKISV